MKLTDAQLILLSKAVQRSDLCIEIAAATPQIAAEKMVAKLAGAGLIEEIEATGNLPSWRTVEDQRYSLRVTGKGLEAIGIATDSPAELSKAKSEKRDRSKRLENRPRPASRKLKATNRGKTHKRSPTAARRSKTTEAKKPNVNAGTQRPGTKIAEILNLLSRKRGATIDEIVAATGWQPHSVRGALSGTIKKKLGYAIATEIHGDTRRYRIDGARG